MFKKTVTVMMAAILFSASALADGNMVKAEVVKVDKSAGKVTLKHGPIKNLDMDAMTMVFKAGEPEMLKGLKAGTKVKFDADRVNGQITVTKLQAGSSHNVVPHEASLAGTLRATSSEVIETMWQKLQDICAGVGVMTGCTVTVRETAGVPPVFNAAAQADV